MSVAKRIGLVGLLALLLVFQGCPGPDNGSNGGTEAEDEGGTTETSGEEETTSDETGSDGGPGWIGISFRGLSPEEVESLQGQRGVHVQGVIRGGPASEAGIARGDIILAVGGESIEGPQVFATFLKTTEVGKTLELTLVRGDATKKISVTATEKKLGKLARKSLKAGAEFLASLQMEKGSWPDFVARDEEPSPALTALAVRTLIGLPPNLRTAHKPAIDKGVAYLLSCEKKGAILDEMHVTQYSNFASAMTVQILCALGRSEDEKVIGRIVDRLLERQLDDGEEFSDLMWQHGAWNYYEADIEEEARADMTTTVNVLHALHDRGLEKDAEAFQQARKFLERTHNFDKHARGARARNLDGGFAFTPRESKAGEIFLPDGDIVFRSYGSATADGLRGLIYCGAEPTDEPVEAALSWLLTHFTVGFNPGFRGRQAVDFRNGLTFYYLNALAKACDAVGQSPIPRKRGLPLDWATRIAEGVLEKQDEDGGWRNRVDVMGEDSPVIASSLALEALRISLENLPEDEE